MNNEIGIFDFLKKYKKCFNSLDDFKILMYSNKPNDYDVQKKNTTKFLFDFIEDVYNCSFTNKLINYPSIFEKNLHYFDATNSTVLDLFYLILYIVRQEHGAYFPILTVVDYIITYKVFSSISIDEAINKIIDIQENKKYYIVDELLYCSYGYEAYFYKMNSEWIKCDYTECIAAYLHEYDISEPEGSPYQYGSSPKTIIINEISEKNVINKYEIECIIKSLNIEFSEVNSEINNNK